jgi:integrase
MATTPGRQKGVRSPEQLPSGSWRGWAKKPGGGRVTKTFPSDQFELAERWMRHMQEVLDGHLPATAMPAEDVAKINGQVAGAATTFAEYAATWAATAGGEWDTRYGRERLCGHWAKALPAGVAAAKISKAMVLTALANWEQRGLSHGSRVNRLGVMRSVMKAAMEDGLRSSDPTHGIHLGRVRTSKPTRVPTDDEVALLMSLMPYYARPAVLLSRHSGLRLGEVIALRWQQLDLTGEYHNGTPSVDVGAVVLRNNTERPYPKGKKVLPVPLTPNTVEALQELLARHPGRPHDHVFRERKLHGQGREAAGSARPGWYTGVAVAYGGERMSYDRWRTLWQKVRDQAGLRDPQPRWHDLRHGVGHDLHAQQAPAYIIQSVLRHADLETSRRYMPDVALDQAAAWMNRAQAKRDGKPGLKVVS